MVALTKQWLMYYVNPAETNAAEVLHKVIGGCHESLLQACIRSISVHCSSSLIIDYCPKYNILAMLGWREFIGTLDLAYERTCFFNENIKLHPQYPSF